MTQPKIPRPDFPPGYVNNPKALLPWSHVEQRLIEAKNYWLCSVRPRILEHFLISQQLIHRAKSDAFI
jgi:hypothetical protein